MRPFHIFALALLIPIFWVPQTVAADDTIKVRIKTILASHGEQAAGIKAFADGVLNELQSVFKYVSYKEIDTSHLDLTLGETKEAPLPGKRFLKITSNGIQNNRARLLLQLVRKNKRLFETAIELQNNGSLIVGGPPHQDGVLMFKVSSTFE
jgi:hypothetical protein